MGKGPARGYSWPPFEEGNTAALTHGAYSPAKVEPRATELASAAIELVPFLAEPAFERAVMAWARAEAKVDLISEWLEENGVLDEDGEPKPALNALLKWEKSASDHRNKLGLDPTSQTRLVQEIAAAKRAKSDLDDLRRQGRKTLDGSVA